MFDAICDICGRQTAEPHVLRIEKRESLHDDLIFVRVICKECVDIMKKDIELLKVTRTTKPPSYAEISYREAAKETNEAVEEAFKDIAILGLMGG